MGVSMTERLRTLHRAVLVAAGVEPRGDEYLGAMVDAVRDDVGEGRLEPSLGLLDALDDLDAYCPDCDDEGVVPYVHAQGLTTCDPADVREMFCVCETARILRAQGRRP